ncbi:MAG TPA: hypothetical protein VN131_03570 [Mobilitalea sp.]|nr:hypothetical protein [Mobilitalea sp.]
MEQQLKYLGKDYNIISAEQEFIIHPAALDRLPVTNDSLKQLFSCTYHVDDFRLMLDTLTVYSTASNLYTNDKKAEETYSFHNLTVSYNGAILIGACMSKEFLWKGFNTACFSYMYVYELIFEDGILITTIDQSKAILRIRKNIELGYRSVANHSDVKIISRFMNSSFIGDYKPLSSDRKRVHYLKEMQRDYNHAGIEKQILLGE